MLRGVDVSSHQLGAVDWPALAAAGYSFAIIKGYERLCVFYGERVSW